MAISNGGTQTPNTSRTWRNYFPQGDLWVFGYGSLIWKPPPHYGTVSMASTSPADLISSQINVYQATLRDMCAGSGSTDHRGTLDQPGRVVTVIEREFWETLDDPLSHVETSSNDRVWGAAYHIPASHAEEVHDYLDVREIDGYTVHYTPFHAVTSSTTSQTPELASALSPITCMVYIGQPANPQFLRDPARREQQDVAEVINRGRGQSGKNTEYLYLLEKALEGLGLGTADAHVTDLVKRVKAIEEESEAAREEAQAEREVRKSLEVSARESAD